MQLKSFRKKLTIKKFIVSLINLINTFALCCLVTIRPITVLADNDDEYLVINDIDQYNAYKFWMLYGLSFSESKTYTSTYNTISESTSTGSITFSGQFSGSLTAAIDLSYVGEIGDTELGIASIIGTETGHIGGGSTSVEMTITPNGNGAEGNQPVTYACIYNAQSTASNALMTCRPDRTSYSTTFTLPDETITFDQLDIFTNSQSSYLVKMLNEGTETGTIGGTLSLSGSGSGSLSIDSNGSSITTNVNVNNLNLVFPSLIGTIDNTRRNLKSIYITDSSNPYCVYFLTDNYFYLDDNDIDFLNTNNISLKDNLVFNFTSTERRRRAGYDLIGFDAYYSLTMRNLGYLTFSDKLNNKPIIPIYVGYKNNMSDDLYRFIYGSDRLIEVLTSGTQLSKTSKQNIDNKKSSFDSTSNDLINIEDNTFDSMDSAIDNVNMDSTLINNSKFLEAATWVRIRFNQLIAQSPWENYLVFCLCLGFALLIVGKIR